jgi:ectoine hydroxylase-related dioxygenase (phytanoyl-CoA dioxygenase family)
VKEETDLVAIEPRRADEEQWRGWKEDGYVVLEDAIQGDDLSRLQAAFERCSEESKPEWLEDVATGKRSSSYFDLPRLVHRDEIFLDMIDHPSTLGILRDFLGEDMLSGGGLTGRTVPPCPISYVGWHPDLDRKNYSQHIKVQVYVNDVGEERGAFAYVPGSHKEGAGPYPRVKNIEAMPGCKTLPGKAGTAVIFNTYGWHTSMINRTLEPRKSLIIGYSVFHDNRNRYNVRGAEWTKRRAELRELLTPEREYLFGYGRIPEE